MELLLHQGELLNLGGNLRGVIVTCLAGKCWLTQAGDSRDYILRNNRQVEVRSRGQVLVSAAAPCRLQLTLRDRPVLPLPVPALAGQP